jgi:hypothetical protein
MEASFGPSQGAAVLDIGGDVGAAVVHTTAALDGSEIEITPDGREWNGTHVAVRRRPTATLEPDAVFCAIFGHLPAGAYRIRVRDTPSQQLSWALTVVGGQVTEVDLG